MLPVLLIPVLALAACGGGDDEEGAVVEAVEAAAQIIDPADCKELANLRFLEQAYFREGKEALTRCEGDAKNPDDDAGDIESVEVSNVEVDGSEATADIAFDGGTFDGQVFSVAVVEGDSDWKVDEITGFAEFDQEKLAQGVEEQVDAEGLPSKVVSCIGKEFREMPRAEFEGAMIGGSTQPIVKVVLGCE